LITEKKKWIRLSVFCIGILLIVSLGIGAVVINTSKAKYLDEEEMSYKAELQDFDVNFVLTYISDGTEHSVTSEDLSNSNGVFRLSANDYPSLKLNIEYTGKGKCYCRFRITESWQHTDSTGQDVITPKALSKYTLDSNFFDNRSDDGYIYCCEALKDESRLFTAITACTAGEDAIDLLSPEDEAQFVDIAVEVEAVQWNQAIKFWNIDRLPWE